MTTSKPMHLQAPDSADICAGLTQHNNGQTEARTMVNPLYRTASG